MAVEHATVALTQTPAKLTHTFADPDDDRTGTAISFINETGVAVRLGSSTVTTSTGLLLAAGASFAMDLEQGEELWAVCASGSHNLYVLRSGV